jgi:hypothetical protein
MAWTTVPPTADQLHGVLRGTVRDIAGRPLSALVDVIGPDVAIAAGPEGTYGGALAPGIYAVEVAVAADSLYQCGHHQITIHAGTITTLDVACSPPAP